MEEGQITYLSMGKKRSPQKMPVLNMLSKSHYISQSRLPKTNTVQNVEYAIGE